MFAKAIKACFFFIYYAGFEDSFIHRALEKATRRKKRQNSVKIKRYGLKTTPLTFQSWKSWTRKITRRKNKRRFVLIYHRARKRKDEK